MGLRSDLSCSLLGTSFPKQQIAHGESTIHGVKEVSDLGGLPDKWALDVGQRNIPSVDLIQQDGQTERAILEDCNGHADLGGSML